MSKLDLSVNLGSLQFKNPVITASGTCGYGQELQKFMDLDLLGAITIKGLSVEPKNGNPTPRIAETASGLLNAIGLENPGLKEFKKEMIGVIREFNTPIIANISGSTLDDFALLAEELAVIEEISALEVNVSCPNIKKGGMAFGTDSELVYEVTKRVKKIFPRPVIIKLSPNVTDIKEIAAAAEKGGADIISLINTILGLAIDLDSQQPVLGNVFGGLSGPAIKPVALRMVYQVRQASELPIIGMGGIMNGEDALEFILAGADAVSVGTATLVEPDASIRILKEIRKYMKKNEIKKISELKGKAH